MNQKHIALFLAAIMLMSVFSFFLSSLLGDNTNGVENTDVVEAPGFDSISGTHMNADLNSLEDGLKITPDGVNKAAYVDYSKIYGTQLEMLGIAPNITQLYSLHGTIITRGYMAYNSTGDFAFEADILYPEVVNFQYAITEQPYNGYYLLTRNEQISSIIGTPTLIGQKDSLKKVIDVSSGNAASSDDFDTILSYVEPGAQYQVVSSIDTIADQHYLELRTFEDGTYSRKEIFLNPANSVIDNVEKLQANSTERGLLYEFVTYEEDNIAVVEISTNESNIFNLAMEQFM